MNCQFDISYLISNQSFHNKCWDHNYPKTHPWYCTKAHHHWQQTCTCQRSYPVSFLVNPWNVMLLEIYIPWLPDNWPMDCSRYPHLHHRWCCTMARPSCLCLYIHSRFRSCRWRGSDNYWDTLRSYRHPKPTNVVFILLTNIILIPVSDIFEEWNIWNLTKGSWCD